jgi:hypothetical protein
MRREFADARALADTLNHAPKRLLARRHLRVFAFTLPFQEGEQAPTPLAYLREIGVDPARQVRVVVVTHWHDDHIGGMAQVVRTCGRAQIAVSDAFTKHDFISGVNVVEPASIVSRSGVREFWEVWNHLQHVKRPATHVSVDKLLWSRRTSLPVRVVALSPSNEDVARGLQQLREFVLNAVGHTLEFVPPLSPNEASVVVWVTVGDAHFLLGADLERPSSDARGWLAILDHADEWRDKCAEVFKVPHHGSAGAYEPRVWDEMLTARRTPAYTSNLAIRSGIRDLASTGGARKVACPLTGHVHFVYCLRSCRHPLRCGSADAS